MIPVDQIRTGRGRGQCTEASIASILEIPLGRVPDLWGGPDAPADDPQPMANRVRLWEWLKADHGVELVGVLFETPRAHIGSAWVAADIFIREQGVRPPRVHLAAGNNPDGVPHFVVCEAGWCVHDPNPLRRGLATCDWIGWLLPLADVPEEALALPSAEWRVA